MPKHLSNLKDVYKKTYEELKNPKSPIGVFLAKIERQNVENPKLLTDAIKEFIKVYEAEEKNFVMPDPNEEVVSYRAEQNRLNANMAVEKKLEEAVVKMQKALDEFASLNMNSKKTPSQEEIAEMTNINDKLRAQRDRVLDAFYKIELEDEQKTIDKLKAEFKAFDHRPEESKVEIPPEIYNSAAYKFRNMPRQGGLEIPTALYGLMRFNDLLNDHEKRMKEAVRKREYEKFVTDRLMGFQAWKNQLAKEQQIYQEISSKIAPSYLEKYNKFMSDKPLNSTYAGCLEFLGNEQGNILVMEDKIKELEESNEKYKNEYQLNQQMLEDETAEFDKQEKQINDDLDVAEKSDYLAKGFAESNETTRIGLGSELQDLETELNKLDVDINGLKEKQTEFRNAVIDRANQVLNYSAELDKLQESLTNNAETALERFLENYNKGVAHLDNELNNHLDIIKQGGLALHVNNEKFLEAEKAYKNYSKEINDKSKELDKLLNSNNDLKDLAEEDLKKESGVTGFFKRNNIFNKKSREEHQRNYENAKNQVNEFEKEVADLKKQIEENEKLRDESQIAMDAYKSAWDTLMNNLKNAVQDSIVYSKDLQESLEKQKKELENVNQEYDNKVKEISDDVVEKKQGSQDILDKASFDLDKLNAQMIMKNNERKVLADKIEGVKERIEKCNETSKNIEDAKNTLASLKEKKEKFLVDKKARLDQLTKDRDHCTYRVTVGLKDLKETTEKYGADLEGYKVLKNYFNEDKVTSNRVLVDLQKSIDAAMEISQNESEKQSEYIKNKENGLLKSFADKMLDKNTFADRSNAMLNENQKDGSVFTYMKQVSELRSSSSKEFTRLEKAVFDVFDDKGNFKLNEQLAKALESDKDREQAMKDIRAQIKEIAEAAVAYEKAKGSASRFTDAGKLRYRFADEMKNITESMLSDFALWDEEKEWTQKLFAMNDNDLYVSKNESFYNTLSHKMTQDAFVGKGELNNMDGFAKAVHKEKQKEEKAKQEIKEKEEPIMEEDEIDLSDFFK